MSSGSLPLPSSPPRPQGENRGFSPPGHTWPTMTSIYSAPSYRSPEPSRMTSPVVSRRSTDPVPTEISPAVMHPYSSYSGRPARKDRDKPPHTPKEFNHSGVWDKPASSGPRGTQIVYVAMPMIGSAGLGGAGQGSERLFSPARADYGLPSAAGSDVAAFPASWVQINSSPSQPPQIPVPIPKPEKRLLAASHQYGAATTGTQVRNHQSTDDLHNSTGSALPTYAVDLSLADRQEGRQSVVANSSAGKVEMPPSNEVKAVTPGTISRLFYVSGLQESPTGSNPASAAKLPDRVQLLTKFLQLPSVYRAFGSLLARYRRWKVLRSVRPYLTLLRRGFRGVDVLYTGIEGLIESWKRHRETLETTHEFESLMLLFGAFNAHLLELQKHLMDSVLPYTIRGRSRNYYRVSKASALASVLVLCLRLSGTLAQGVVHSSPPLDTCAAYDALLQLLEAASSASIGLKLLELCCADCAALVYGFETRSNPAQLQVPACFSFASMRPAISEAASDSLDLSEGLKDSISLISSLRANVAKQQAARKQALAERQRLQDSFTDQVKLAQSLLQSSASHAVGIYKHEASKSMGSHWAGAAANGDTDCRPVSHEQVEASSAQLLSSMVLANHDENVPLAGSGTASGLHASGAHDPNELAVREQMQDAEGGANSLPPGLTVGYSAARNSTGSHRSVSPPPGLLPPGITSPAAVTSFSGLIDHSALEDVHSKVMRRRVHMVLRPDDSDTGAAQGVRGRLPSTDSAATDLSYSMLDSASQAWGGNAEQTRALDNGMQVRHPSFGSLDTGSTHPDTEHSSEGVPVHGKATPEASPGSEDYGDHFEKPTDASATSTASATTQSEHENHVESVESALIPSDHNVQTSHSPVQAAPTLMSENELGNHLDNGLNRTDIPDEGGKASITHTREAEPNRENSHLVPFASLAPLRIRPSIAIDEITRTADATTIGVVLSPAPPISSAPISSGGASGEIQMHRTHSEQTMKTVSDGSSGLRELSPLSETHSEGDTLAGKVSDQTPPHRVFRFSNTDISLVPAQQSQLKASRPRASSDASVDSQASGTRASTPGVAPEVALARSTEQLKLQITALPPHLRQAARRQAANAGNERRTSLRRGVPSMLWQGAHPSSPREPPVSPPRAPATLTRVVPAPPPPPDFVGLQTFTTTADVVLPPIIAEQEASEEVATEEVGAATESEAVDAPRKIVRFAKGTIGLSSSESVQDQGNSSQNLLNFAARTSSLPPLQESLPWDGDYGILPESTAPDADPLVYGYGALPPWTHQRPAVQYPSVAAQLVYSGPRRMKSRGMSSMRKDVRAS